jgi:hypothetical protein
VIKFKEIENTRTVRETTAPFEYMKDGKLAVEDIRVRYFSQTIADVRKERSDALARAAQIEEFEKQKDDLREDGSDKALAKLAELEKQTSPGESEFPWLSKTLAPKIESLPDILDAKDKPIAITEDNLSKISVVNLRALAKAMEDDLRPKEQPSK